MKLKKIINKQRERRSYRVRNKLRGDATRPRLCVKRTLKHFSCQLIDDEAGKTLAAASTVGQSNGGNCEAAAKVGSAIAEKAKAAGVTTVRLDRGTCRYHGRVAAFADAAREGGLEF